MTYVSKAQLNGRIEDGLISNLVGDTFTSKRKKPQDLITWNRLDIGMRALYLELKDKAPSLAKKIYSEDIRAQTLGAYVDPDNLSKSGFENYETVFRKIHASISSRGFDPDVTLIPLSASGSILNGAHRTSSALVLNKKVACVETGLPPITCDYRYFYDRGVDTELIEMAVVRLIRSAKDIFIGFLWPSGERHYEVTEEFFKNVLYKRHLSLTTKGAFNLLYQCYSHMDWIGSEDKGFPGINQKLVECFPRGGDVTVIAFQPDGGLKDVLALKEEIRQINGIGFSSVHVTDTQEEAVNLAQFLFNKNGRHYLNNADPIKERHIKTAITLREQLQEDGREPESIVIDGSWILDLYGLRKAADLDVIISETSSDLYRLLGLHNRDEQLVFHNRNADELVYDPRNHFIVAGIKVIGFDQLAKMKRARQQRKDEIDLELMALLSRDDKFSILRTRLEQKFLYAKIRTRRVSSDALGKVLRAIGLYDTVRRLYRRFRGLPAL